MRKTLIRILGGYTEPGKITVKPTEMTSSTVNRNFTNIELELKAGNLNVKVSAWDDAQAMKMFNAVMEKVNIIPEEDNPLVG